MYAKGRSISIWLERGGRGPTVVLLHGLADDHRLWRRVEPQLQRRYETIQVDLPGHGSSGPVPEGASIEWFADETAAALDSLGVREFVLVGLSMGGGVAQFVARAHPSRLRGLVLVSTSPVFDDATRQRFMDRAALARREGMAPLPEPALRRWFTGPFLEAHARVVAATRDAFLRTDPVNFARASHANANRNSLPHLASVSCPVLYVAGADDVTNRGAQELFEEHLPNVQVAILENASHLLPVEAPRAFLSLMERFLASLNGLELRAPAPR